MNFIELNDKNRKRMNNLIKEDFSFKWEDNNLLNILSGELPSISMRRYNDNTVNEIMRLEALINEYDFFRCNNDKDYINKLKDSIDRIKNKDKNWIGYNFLEVDEAIKKQRFCIIEGEAGIGKSYFIYLLEQSLSEKNIPHLCVYGKIQKNVSDIDIEEIIKAHSDKFVFIFDAINELEQGEQVELLDLIKSLRSYKNIRIVLTYRSYSMDEKIVEDFKNLAEFCYLFQGVSFESAFDMLVYYKIPDLYKYEDILYSRNPLFLNMLRVILDNKKIKEDRINSTASITYILESYVKESLRKYGINKGPNFNVYSYWLDIKKIAEEMYLTEKKYIKINRVLSIVQNKDFFDVIKSMGMFNFTVYDNENICSFSSEYLTDFLIARSLFDNFKDKSIDEIVNLIEKKKSIFYGANEPLILIIFDKYSDDYNMIYDILERTGLIADLQHETILKVVFKTDDHIKKFVEVFCPQNSSELIKFFGGYINKPFNCINYLNDYFLYNKTAQLRELTEILSGQKLSNVKLRLKSILYLTLLQDSDKERNKEAFYFALWCSSASNQDVRCLATKLLYEIIKKDSGYCSILISSYFKVIDPYIKESIIYILSSCLKQNYQICEFFNKLIKSHSYLSANSIKRISQYLNKEYSYIHWSRRNLYFPRKRNISKVFDSILMKTELEDKEWLPFKYLYKERIEVYTKFIAIDKRIIFKLNCYLNEKFACVKHGECRGSMDFENYIIKNIFKINARMTLDIYSILSSLESVFKEIYTLFEEKYTIFNVQYGYYQNSKFRKFMDIAVGYLYGSLMCNYYTNQFSSFNTEQNMIGYEVYDPLRYDEKTCITAPIPVYNERIEKLNDCIIEKIDFSMEKDQNWVENLELSGQNLLNVLTPVTLNNTEWIMLAGQIKLYEKKKKFKQWEDIYFIYSCSSDDVFITNDGNARYLTIELELYEGCLEEYRYCINKPWLCKKGKLLNSETDIIDETHLILPPADIINFFDLHIEYSDMSWRNNENEVVVLCNNNKSSYYKDFIIGSIFIRKQYFDRFLEKHTIKYFSYTEKRLRSGFEGSSSAHFEVENGNILKKIMRDDNSKIAEVSEQCIKCEHKLYQPRRNFNWDEVEKIIFGRKEKYENNKE